MKNFLKKYGHAWVFSYGILYMIWFTWLEKTVTNRYYLIESALDDYIPFLEIFVVPYLLWFVFIAVTSFYFFFNSKEDYYKLAKLFIIGMTAFLVICTIYPNGQSLRPTVFPRDNIFIDMVKYVYSTDTPTNVFPSIHVYNSLACYIAIRHSKKLSNHKRIQWTSCILTTLIILSTVFLKQHSILDAVGAFLIVTIAYQMVYHPVKVKKTKHSLAHRPI